MTPEAPSNALAIIGFSAAYSIPIGGLIVSIIATQLLLRIGERDRSSQGAWVIASVRVR